MPSNNARASIVYIGATSYSALATKDANTIYFIHDDQVSGYDASRVAVGDVVVGDISLDLAHQNRRSVITTLVDVFGVNNEYLILQNSSGNITVAASGIETGKFVAIVDPETDPYDLNPVTIALYETIDDVPSGQYTVGDSTFDDYFQTISILEIINQMKADLDGLDSVFEPAFDVLDGGTAASF